MKKHLLILSFAILLLPLVASAIELNLEYPSFGGLDINEDQELGDIVAWFYYLIVGISGLAAFAMLVFGGIQWLSSAGSTKGISAAKERIKNALLGLLLILGSFLVLQIINPELTFLQTPELGNLEISPSGIGDVTFIDTGESGSGGVGQCTSSLSGECATSSNFSVFGAQVQNAQAICQQESQGSAAGLNRGCFLTGSANSCELSVGILQYNLVDRCAGLITGERISSGGILRCTCEVPTQNALNILNSCLSNSGAAWRASFAFNEGVSSVVFSPAVANVSRQIQRGFEVFNGQCGGNQGSWSPWSTRAQCGITASCVSY